MRIPVGPGEAAGAAYLLEGDAAAPAGAYAVRFALFASGHIAGCACCAPRGAAAAALAAMFRARATGAAPFFTRVIPQASLAGKAAVQSALVEDVVVAARYRAG